MTDHVAHAEVEISASPQQVWDALIDPEAISYFSFGTRVTLDQDGNDTAEQAERFSANWQMMLGQLKEYVEEGRGALA